MFKKELSYYFSSPIAYIVIGLYQLAISLFLWVIPGQWNIIDSGYAQVDGLFQLSPWLMMLLCPALTMRLLSEERQSGIWDLIRTKPISLSRIMFGKYFAAWTLVLIGLLPCFVHYFVVAYMPWAVALQASLPTGFSRQEYWSGLPCPSPGDLPNPRVFCVFILSFIKSEQE